LIWPDAVAPFPNSISANLTGPLLSPEPPSLVGGGETTGGVLEELPPQAATINTKKHSTTFDFITWFTLKLYELS